MPKFEIIAVTAGDIVDWGSSSPRRPFARGRRCHEAKLLCGLKLPGLCNQMISALGSEIESALIDSPVEEETIRPTQAG
jgi:hypothetical protein